MREGYEHDKWGITEFQFIGKGKGKGRIERKKEKGKKYWGFSRHRSIPSVKLNLKHRKSFACSRNFHG
jgi:hypothetical protein